MTSIGTTQGVTRLLAASIVARVPAAMLSIGLLVQARHLTGSYAQAGIVAGAYAIALGVGGPPLGNLVDRYGQTVVLLASAAVGTLLLLTLAVVPAHAPLAVLVALAAGIGVGTPPVEASLRALVPVVVADPESVRRLYSLEAAAVELTYIAGPPLAITLGVLWSPGATLGVAAVVLFAATAGFAVQPASRRAKPEPDGPPRRGSLHSPALRTLVMIMVAVGALLGADEVAVIDAAQSLHRAAADVPLFAVWGAGSFVGGLVITRFGGGARTAGTLALLLGGLAAGHLALIPVSRTLVGLGVVLFLAGTTIAPTEASISAMVDRASPKESMTEAFAWLTTAAATGSAVGAAAAGVVADWGGPAATFALGGGAGVLVLLVIVLRLRTLVAPVASADAEGLPVH